MSCEVPNPENESNFANTALTFKEVRNAEIGNASELFYELLDDYLALNQQYLSSDVDENERQKILSQIGNANEKLNDLAHGISSNNEKTQNDIDRTFREHESEMNSMIFGTSNQLKRDKEFLRTQIAMRETLHKLLSQLRAENSRETIKYWVCIVALICLASAFGFLYQKM